MKVQKGFILCRVKEEDSHIISTSQIRSDLASLSLQVQDDAKNMAYSNRQKFLSVINRDLDLFKLLLDDIENEDNRLSITEIEIVKHLMEVIINSSNSLQKSQSKEILQRNANTLLAICENCESAKFY